MGGSQFRKAKKFYKQKKYSEIIKLLEPQVFRFRENFTFFFLLGMSCLMTGDVGGAYSYLTRAHDLNPENIDTLLGLSVVYLKKQDPQKTLSTWFLVLDRDPHNKIAQRGLKILRKYTDSEDLLEFLDSGKINKILPKPAFSMKKLTKLIITATLFITASGVFYGTFIYINQNKHVPQRTGVESLTLKGTIDTSVTQKTIYHFNDKELKNELLKIKNLFNNFDDNRAMREINRVLLSNADSIVKNQVRVLEGYLSKPSFATLKTKYTYREVQKTPLLYRNCFVIWKGRVSNLVITENSFSFDLLVGYADEKVLEGIVPVNLNFGAKIDSSLPIDVLGKVIIDGSKIRLLGIGIHQFQ